jgi:hypothetical protein
MLKPRILATGATGKTGSVVVGTERGDLDRYDRELRRPFPGARMPWLTRSEAL